MKGGGGVGVSVSGKRRWRGLVIGVLFLVILSMLVPLAFLLGLHNGFHSSNPNGYVPVHKASVSGVIKGYDKHGIGNTFNHSENDRTTHINEIVKKLAPKISKDGIFFSEITNFLLKPTDVLGNFSHGTKNETSATNATYNSQHKKGTPVLPHAVMQPLSNTSNTKIAGAGDVTEYLKDGVDENENCELKFGSYCLWRKEHREEMRDSVVKKLKDQLFVARAYYPSIAKLPSQDKLTRELKQNIQELERVLSESATDVDLPPEIGKKLHRMEAAISRAKSFPVDCGNVDKKLRQIFEMTKDEANFHTKQSAFLYQLAVQTMPKSLHCLSMRLTVEYFKSLSMDMELSQADKYSDPSLHHFVIFSNNVLASSVVINSTVLHASESKNLVFHVLTDEQNYFAMKFWFFRNSFKEATIRVLNIEQLNLEYHDKATLFRLSLPVEFRVSLHSVDSPTIHNKMQYISIFSHAHYLLPGIFQNLNKVVVLDDDVVVQKDLSGLWNLDMEGKVNGAVQFCSMTLGQLKNLGENSFDKRSCAWMSGLNVVDLVRWRELDLTETYRRLVREVSMGEASVEAIALRASLLAFQDLIYALDGEWVLSGLGHEYGLDIQAIKKASVLHYNGNMKPWLELGIPRYKQYWKKFLNLEDQLLGECNVNP